MTVDEGAGGRLRATWRLLVKELTGFGVVGSCAFVLDLSLFQLLYAGLGAGAVTAKLWSTLVSMTFAYAGHRYWSFAHRARTGLSREYLLFTLVNGVTLLLGLAIVWTVSGPLGQSSALVLQAANVGSIAVGTAVRFLAYRRWVFPAVAGAGPEPAVALAGAAPPGRPPHGH
jgi:putative flippase GtrA